MPERRDYDTLAQDINPNEITSCEGNANILRQIRDGDPSSEQLFIMNRDDGETLDGDFLVAEGDDLGWLGYFIGRSEVIKNLQIYYLPEGGDEINEFFEGMSQNLSIKSLEINSQIGDDCWNRLGSFFENNRNLAYFEVQGFTIGHEGAQNLASALGRMHHNSLKHLSVKDTEVVDEGFTEIATTLRSQSQLEYLDLYDNSIGRDGCIALGNTLSRWPVSNKLENLRIGNNTIDDEGLQALVSGMMNCRSLKRLSLSHNQSITAAGLRSLFPLLQSESHYLEKLLLYGINVGDDGAIALAEGLRGNKSLKELWLYPSTSGITAVGWSAFSKLLCDTSTINNTYLSNHTLTKIGDYGHDNEATPRGIQRLLTTNTYRNRQWAAIYKILQSHPDLDMEPFIKLKMKSLPSVMSWFERVEPIKGDLIRLGRIESCQSRKLSALYKFVRAMPDLAVTGYWEGRVIDIEAKKRMLDEEEAVAWERLGG
jgi:hypothetical protein